MNRLLLIAMVIVAGCATVPDGPSVLVLPGTGKSFEQFRADESECRSYAQSQAGQYSDASLQQRYDFGYQQCMYVRGHKIPMSVREVRRAASRSPSAPPVGTSAPPPPPPGPPPGEAPADYKG